MTDALQIPAELIPADGRFGAGPSKIQTSHLDALAATGSSLMGTSHRQKPVKSLVGRVRTGLRELFTLSAEAVLDDDLGKDDDVGADERGEPVRAAG